MAKKKTTTRVTRAEPREEGFFQRLQGDLENRQSYLSLILGVLIVVAVGVLLFNYFNRNREDLTEPLPGENQQVTQEQTGDVAKEQLPGKYTVKEGDTLFAVAQNYYEDGFKYTEIVRVNNLPNENAIEVGQVLEIPKLEESVAQTSPTPESTQAVVASPIPVATEVAQATPAIQAEQPGTGGAENQTIWGERITGVTYTVKEGDWLSKIAGRAYGDIMAYQRLAQGNNIANPDLIEVGMEIKIPR